MTKSPTPDPIKPDPGPVLIYDGDCGFCRYSVRYWQRLTADRVRYLPYQQAAADYPQIAPADFRNAIQYITPHGRVVSGAEAAFRTLAHAPGQHSGLHLGLRLYQGLPGLAPLAEWVYAFIAAHRSAAYRVSVLLWGRDPLPPRFELTVRLFLIGLALIYFSAFLSFGTQVQGLVGSQGLLPVHDYLAAVQARFGPERYWLFPTLFWLTASDRALQAACGAGMLFSVLLLVNLWPRICLAVLFVLYLSLFYAGQVFMTFQWDLLLLETGVLALALCTRSPLAIWVARWLVFRFMFMSGLVKISGDPAWGDFAALGRYFETQPLPTPLAWYAAGLPAGVLAFATAATLAIELMLPLFIFAPRRLRFIAAWGIILLQIVILATGNYGYFNLLALLLCLTLFDDAAIARLLPHGLRRRLTARPAQRPTKRLAARPGKLVAAYALFALLLGSYQLVETWRRPALVRALSGAAPDVEDFLSAPRLVNSYGPFAAMTVERPEIIIEGSRDGTHWREYGFRYKPGDVYRRPAWNIPHQPRLDWQMWFAAAETQQQHPWFGRLMQGLLRNSPEILDLLADNPFADAPPTYVRALLYDYRFTGRAAHDAEQWWVRRQSGIYYPAVRLP